LPSGTILQGVGGAAGRRKNINLNLIGERFTVKPVFFACHLFPEFRDLGAFWKNNGSRRIY